MSDLFMAGIYEQVTRQLKDGKAFVLEAPDHVPSVWGEDADVIWSEGEPLFVVGPQGVGKSTVLQQVALATLRGSPRAAWWTAGSIRNCRSRISPS
jgi:energy-coupling factor transporter ATP-binding protein EcfA2